MVPILYISFLINVLVHRLIPLPDLVLHSLEGFEYEDARIRDVVLQTEHHSLRPVSEKKLLFWMSKDAFLFVNAHSSGAESCVLVSRILVPFR